MCAENSKEKTARRNFLTVLKSFNSKNTNITLCSKIDPNNNAGNFSYL